MIVAFDVVIYDNKLYPLVGVDPKDLRKKILDEADSFFQDYLLYGGLYLVGSLQIAFIMLAMRGVSAAIISGIAALVIGWPFVIARIKRNIYIRRGRKANMRLERIDS